MPAMLGAATSRCRAAVLLLHCCRALARPGCTDAAVDCHPPPSMLGPVRSFLVRNTAQRPRISSCTARLYLGLWRHLYLQGTYPMVNVVTGPLP